MEWGGWSCDGEGRGSTWREEGQSREDGGAIGLSGGERGEEVEGFSGRGNWKSGSRNREVGREDGKWQGLMEARAERRSCRGLEFV